MRSIWSPAIVTLAVFANNARTVTPFLKPVSEPATVTLLGLSALVLLRKRRVVNPKSETLYVLKNCVFRSRL
jgi:hypothetical protein